jgi:C-terminal processing protease CtpA/Prc
MNKYTLVWVGLAGWLSFLPFGQAQVRWNHQIALEETAALTKKLYISSAIGRTLQEDLLAYAQTDAFAHLSPAELADTVTILLRQKSNNQHFLLQHCTALVPYAAATKRSKETVEPFIKLEKSLHILGFEEVGLLPGNIGYIDYRYFASKKDSEKSLALAMSALASTDALILDLRNNQGGYVETMLLFSSYFFKNKTQLSSTYYRHEQRRVRNTTKARVKGNKYLYRPVYILTSLQTRSAAEALSYHLQQNGVAVVVGATTAGLASPAELHAVAKEYLFFVPVGQETSALTGSNWENTGVVPDVNVPSEQALAQAQVRALNGLLQLGGQTADNRQALEKRIQQLEQSIEIQD